MAGVWTAAKRAKQSQVLKARWAKKRAAKNGRLGSNDPIVVVGVPRPTTVGLADHLREIEGAARKLRESLESFVY